jgi:hypothetical protein
MEQIGAVENAHALLKAVYQNPGVPLPVRMRAAIACLPFEVPKLAVTAVVSEQNFAEVLEHRLRPELEAATPINVSKPEIEVKPSIQGWLIGDIAGSDHLVLLADATGSASPANGQSGARCSSA